jgi:hypothetical protein
MPGGLIKVCYPDKFFPEYIPKARVASPIANVLLPIDVGRAARALTAMPKLTMKITHLNLYSVYLQLLKYRVDCLFNKNN